MVYGQVYGGAGVFTCESHTLGATTDACLRRLRTCIMSQGRSSVAITGSSRNPVQPSLISGIIACLSRWATVNFPKCSNKRIISSLVTKEQEGARLPKMPFFFKNLISLDLAGFIFSFKLTMVCLMLAR